MPCDLPESVEIRRYNILDMFMGWKLNDSLRKCERQGNMEEGLERN